MLVLCSAIKTDVSRCLLSQHSRFTHPVIGTESFVHLLEVVARLIVLSFDLNAAVVVQVIGVAVAVDTRRRHEVRMRGKA